MFKSLFTVVLMFVLLLSMSAFAGKYDLQRVHNVTAEDEARFEEKMQNSSLSLNTEKAPTELGRTWYDYATNGHMGRMMDYALTSTDGQDGIHFTFMKRQPDATGNRYVTYDYWDLNLNLFFGNQSVTEAQATGWGRLVNGVNDEALIIMHGGGLHYYTDASEAGYSFTELFSTAGGVFPGIARHGNSVFLIGQLTNGNWVGGDTIAVTTDYHSNWAGYNIWQPDPLTTDLGTSELWPTFNPTNTTELSVMYAPDITASAPNGSIEMATTPDLGATWTTMQIHNDDDIVNGNQQLIIENFSGQGNEMYGMDGTYHYVCGAVQGVSDTALALIDYFPLLYWNDRDQAFVELSDISKSKPSDTTSTLLVDFRPGNGLGGFNYPSMSEGPNGELVAIWQEWEDDGTGLPVMVTPAGGTDVFCTDIHGAYSNDGGMTWSAPFYITGTSAESDVFPNITPTFSFNATSDSAILDIAYMWDTNPGVSLFAGGNDASEVVWYYERVAVAATPGTPGSIDGEDGIVQEFKLSQNYPNPFNPSTNIKFSVSTATDVTLDVFNVVGEKIATLINGKVKSGETIATFNGSNHASGVYFYQLTTGDLVQTRKMLLVK
jgi:type IX secretion system substrate protein